jgi:hypothetical protein
LKKLIIISFTLVLLSLGFARAQDGFYDAYDYNRWSSEFCLRGGPIHQESDFSFNNQSRSIKATSTQLKQQGNWTLAGSYVGRHDYFLFALSGSMVKSLESNEELFIESSIFYADAAIGLMPGWDGIYIVAGGRLYDAGINVAKASACDEPFEEGGEQWLDPFAGLRMDLSLFDWLGFYLYGDAGGFGAGSELSWNSRAAFKLYIGGLAVHLGYHAEYSDYKSDPETPFDIEVTTQGPELGLSYNF